MKGTRVRGGRVGCADGVGGRRKRMRGKQRVGNGGGMIDIKKKIDEERGKCM